MLISGARGKSKLWENQGIQVVVTAYNTSEYLERCFRGGVNIDFQSQFKRLNARA